MTFQHRDLRSCLLPSLTRIRDELTKRIITNPSLRALAPQITTRGLANLRRPLGRISQLATSLAIHKRPSLLDKVGRIRSHRPLVTIRTDFSIYIEVIKQHKFIDQRMMVRRHIFSKDTQGRIPIPLGNVPK